MVGYMNSKKISIIVPVYNMASDGKLEYCLNSLVSQTISDYEIIAVDDCSTDNSMEILRDFQSRYPEKFIAIHSNVNLRQGGAKNIGIRRATGEWIGFIDSDDWITADMYEKLLKKAEDTGADLVGCDYSMVAEHTMEVGKIVYNNHSTQTGILDHEKYKSLIKTPGSMVIKIYKRQMVVENELWFPEHIFYEDNCMGIIWPLFSKHFERVEEPLYYYYQHEASTVHGLSVDRCMDRMVSMEKLITDCKKYGFFDEYKDALEYRFTEIYFVNTLYSYLIGVRPRKVEFLKQLTEGIRNHFPEFEKNAEYQKNIHPEQKKQIGYLMKSERLFLVYYILLSGYRNFRKKLRG